MVEMVKRLALAKGERRSLLENGSMRAPWDGEPALCPDWTNVTSRGMTCIAVLQNAIGGDCVEYMRSLCIFFYDFM